jgi:hypothetical protein
VNGFRKAAAALSASVGLSCALVLGLAASAGAAVGPQVGSAGQAGMSATGAQFRDVRGQVFARNGGGFASTQLGIGASVSLWTGTAAHGTIIQLGWSTGTGAPHEPWSPAVGVYVDHVLAAHQNDAAVHDQTCVGTTCTPGDSLNAADQQQLRYELFYDRPAGNVIFTATAMGTGQTYLGFYHVGTGVSFNQARVTSDFGNTPFDSSGYVSSPSAQKLYLTWSKVGLTSYSGHRASLVSWWERDHVVLVDAVGGAHAGPLFSSGSAFHTFINP